MKLTFESLTKPGERLRKRQIAARLLSGDIIVVRGLLAALDMEEQVQQTTRKALLSVLGPERANQVIAVGIERIHDHVNAEELLAIAEDVYQAMRINSLQVGALLARRILGRHRPVFIERTPNVRFHVPYGSTARASGGKSLEAFRQRRGEGKVTPHASHRDSWFNCPNNGLNFWIALGRVIPGNGLAFYPTVYKQPVPVNESGKTVEGGRLGMPLTIDLQPGDAVLFAGEQLHASELNRTDLTRYAVSYRMTLTRPHFPGRHIHHYALTALRHGTLTQLAELPARLQWSYLRQLVGASKWAQHLPRSLRTTPTSSLQAQITEPSVAPTRAVDSTTIALSKAHLEQDRALAINATTCVALDAKGSPRAFARRCPHEGADLAGARVEGDNVFCPWHNLTFNLRDGGSACSGLKSLRLYSTRESHDEIEISTRRMQIAPPHATSTRKLEVPKTMWMLWLQGWEQAPDIVQACLRSWQQHHPEFTIHCLSRTTLSDYIDLAELLDPSKVDHIPAEALSDIVRIALLKKYGGIWVDATVYCNAPVGAWLGDFMPEGFFAFEKPGPDRLVSSWFIAAVPNNHIVDTWHKLTRDYWANHQKPHAYFWFHYLFEQGYESSTAFRRAWDLTPKLSADGPHYFVPYEHKLAGPMTFEHACAVSQKPPPVFKLTHKLASSTRTAGSALSYFVEVSQTLPLNKPAGRTLALGPSAMRSPAASSRVLVGWYGAFDGHGTIGDLYSAQSLTAHLAAKGHEVHYTSYTDFAHLAGSRVPWDGVEPSDYDAFVFTCGPILKQHPQLTALFSRFHNVFKIGVGVSLFAPDHFNYVNPFDHVFAREGFESAHEDIALVAPGLAANSHELESRSRANTIGIVLHGPQSEYGDDKCLASSVDAMIETTAQALAQEHGGHVLRIENHLRRSGLSSEEIESQYQSCSLVLTTRFHGAMMALRNHVPFVAVDQIAGGAKVHRLLGGKGWRHVLRGDQLSAEQLVLAAREAMSGTQTQALLKFRTTTMIGSAQTLGGVSDLLALLGEDTTTHYNSHR